MKQLGVISLSKKETGVMFVKGKDYYTSITAIIFSILALLLMLFVIVSKTSRLG